MASEKIKITRKEIEDLYDIEEDNTVQKEEEITITENKPETWEEATERIDKENEKKWLLE